MKIGPFEIIETLGGGGSGIVYRARHETLGRMVAVKQLNRQVQEGDRTFERFRREAQIMAAIRSDYVVTLYSYQVVDGRPLLEMECLDRGSLERSMSAGPIGMADCLRIVEHILLGLKALHHAGIVHRDVKPANVLQDDEGRFKLTDFGLSVIESDMKPTLEAATIRYVAPECIAENPTCDFRSDLYSVGMVAYEALLGSSGFYAAFPDLSPAAAFGSKWLGWLKDRDREATPLHVLRPDIPSPVSQFVARLMAKEPDRRYVAADAALEALAVLDLSHPGPPSDGHRYLGPGPTKQSPAGVPRRDRRPGVALGLLLLTLAVLAVVAGAWLRTPAQVTAGPALPGSPDRAPTGRIRAHIVGLDGNPLPGVALRLLPGGQTATTETDGSYLVAELTPGRYELTASREGYHVMVRPVSVRAGADSTESLVLVPVGPLPPPQGETLVEQPGIPGPDGPPPPATEVKRITDTKAPGVVARPRLAPTVAGVSTDETSRVLSARVNALAADRRVIPRETLRVSLEMSTRPAPFLGRGITADYVVTLRTADGPKTFSGSHLGFAEVTLRNEVIDKVAVEIVDYLASLSKNP